MKLKIAILATIMATTTLSVFGQGYVTFAASTGRLWNEFTTPGVGVRGNANINVAFLWALPGAVDAFPAVGTQFSQSAGAANKQVATNGVDNTAIGLPALQGMLTSGWSFASNGVSLASATITGTGGFNYGQFQMVGSAASTTYQFIVVAWNATAGLTAILNGSVAALGWSNPFNYTTGASAADPAGTALFSANGMNQFGVAAVPEPTTLALAGLGAASLLIFRKRKQ